VHDSTTILQKSIAFSGGNNQPSRAFSKKLSWKMKKRSQLAQRNSVKSETRSLFEPFWPKKGSGFCA
jgi:hypothetical protein